MHFHNSYTILHLIWIMPLLALLTWYGWSRRRRRVAMMIANPDLAATLTSTVSTTRRRCRDVLLLVACGLLFIAMGGPRWGTKLVPRPAHTRDIMVVLDTSRSMLARDIAPSRLQHAKWFIGQLINQTPGDRYGLIAFAGTAFLECPLTQDRNGLVLFLEDIDTDTIPAGGTNIENALTEALRAFKAAEGRHRAILLITDGDELQGDTAKLLDELNERNIPLYIVGIGDPDIGSFIQIEGNKFITDNDGNRVRSKLNEKSLQNVAAAVGGTYVHSTVVHDGVNHILNKIRSLVPEQQEDNAVSRPIERYQVPLVVAVLCLLMRIMTGERRRDPNAGYNRPGIRGGSMASVVPALLLASGMWLRSQSALAAPPAPPPANSPGETQSAPRELDEETDAPTRDTSHSINNVPALGDTNLQPPMQEPDQTTTIGDEKAGLAHRSIAAIKEKLATIEDDPFQEAYLHYNLAVNYQMLGQMDKAEEAYTAALDREPRNTTLKASSYQNLGAIQHAKARELIARDPDEADTNLAGARDYYREALRQTPGNSDIAANLELVARDRLLVEEIRNMQQQLGDLSDDAKEAAEAARELQEQANKQENSSEAAEKQSQAMDQTQQAEDAARELAEAAREMGQSQAAEQVDDAADSLANARKAQQQALEDLARGEKDNAGKSGEEAGEHIDQALSKLGGKPPESHPGEDDEGEQQTAEQQDEQEESDDSGEDMAGIQENEETEGTEQTGASSADPSAVENLDRIQALRILEDLQRQEKDLKQEIKKFQKQNARIQETDRNW